MVTWQHAIKTGKVQRKRFDCFYLKQESLKSTADGKKTFIISFNYVICDIC